MTFFFAFQFLAPPLDTRLSMVGKRPPIMRKKSKKAPPHGEKVEKKNKYSKNIFFQGGAMAYFAPPPLRVPMGVAIISTDHGVGSHIMKNKVSNAICLPGACPGGGGAQGAWAPPPPQKLKSQKKKSSEQILSYFTCILLLF